MDVDEEADLTSKILIVDDNQLNIEALSQLLLQFGLASSYACSGPQAIRMVKNRLNQEGLHPYQLIFCDYSMPKMDGFACVRQIRNDITHLRVVSQRDDIRLPFFCCITAYDKEQVSKKATISGMNYTMMKPIFKEQLDEFFLSSGLDLLSDD